VESTLWLPALARAALFCNIGSDLPGLAGWVRNSLSMNNREFMDYLRQKRLDAIREEVQAEKKPPASESRR
jgi:hypothetical protein